MHGHRNLKYMCVLSTTRKSKSSATRSDFPVVFFSWRVQTVSLIPPLVLPSTVFFTVVADTPQYCALLSSAEQTRKAGLLSTASCLHIRSTCFTIITSLASLRKLLPSFPLVALH